MTGAAQEVVKNLMLKGVRRIIILEWPTAEEGTFPRVDAAEGMLFKPDLAAHGESSSSALAQTVVDQAADLNPTTELSHVTLESCEAAEEYIRGAAVLILTNTQDAREAFALDAICRRHGTALFWLLTRGYESVCWSSLGPDYAYCQETKKTTAEGETMTETRQETLAFAPLPVAWERHWASGDQEGRMTRKRRTGQPADFCPRLRAMQEQIRQGEFWKDEGGRLVECAPVNSIVGGICTQEVVKVITGRDRPIHNVFLFDGKTLDSRVISIGCPSE